MVSGDRIDHAIRGPQCLDSDAIAAPELRLLDTDKFMGQAQRAPARAMRASEFSKMVALSGISRLYETGNRGHAVGKYEKLLFRILRGASGTNIAFEDLRQVLLRPGFTELNEGVTTSSGKKILRKRSICSEMTTKPRPIKCVKCEQ
jgi:hypothetical protein